MSLQTISFGSKGDLALSFPEVLGSIALFENLSTSIGYQALDVNLLGILNSVYGYQAVGASTAVSGDGLSAFGTQALYYNRGSFNSAVGARAGYSNVTGSNNVHVGYTSGFHNVIGSDQTFLGYASGMNTLGHNNVFVGSLAGSSESTTSNNIGVGYNANSTAGNGIAIGSDANVRGVNTIALGESVEASGSNSFVVGPRVTSTGSQSLILMPRQDGLPFTSTRNETLNIYNRVLGEREITGNYKVSVLGDRILLDNSFNRVNMDTTGMSFYSDSGITYLSPVNYVSDVNFMSGSVNFSTPSTFQEGVTFNGPTTLNNIQKATVSNLFVSDIATFSGSALFDSTVSMVGNTIATNLTATDADIGTAHVNNLSVSSNLYANLLDAEDIDAEIASVEKLTVTEATDLKGGFTLNNCGSAAEISHDLSVGGHLSADTFNLTSGELTVPRLVVTERILIGDVSLSNVELENVTGDFSVAGVIFADSNVDVRSNICFRNYLDPAMESRWNIGLDNPDMSNPQLADLVFASSDATTVRFTQDFATSVMNFTGSHTASHTMTDAGLRDSVGKIVVSSGVYNSLDGESTVTVDEAIPVLALSDKPYDPAVFGVVSAVQDDIENHVFCLGNMKFIKSKRDVDTRIRVNSVGEGCVLVCSANGPIRNGDLIVSSGVPGYGMRQDGDTIRNCTVAKATQDCDFEGGGLTLVHKKHIYAYRLIGCVYKM
eukprot:jgi/Tetstr1/447314/TSEL_034751.t1